MAEQKADKLHLADYQPRGTSPLLRLTYDKTFPEVAARPSTYVQLPQALRKTPPEPPMRDAVADLIQFVQGVHADLNGRGLQSVEITVGHDHGLARTDGEGAGWHFTANVLAVPYSVINDQFEAFNESQAEARTAATV